MLSTENAAKNAAENAVSADSQAIVFSSNFFYQAYVFTQLLAKLSCQRQVEETIICSQQR